MKGSLIVFCGLPSSGKTTIARLIASQLKNTVHVQTDTLRFMFPKPSYSREESTFVYNAMFQVGKEALRRGFNVIFDATFLKEDYRSEAATKLARYYSSITYVAVTCNLHLILERNQHRKGLEVVSRETILRFHRMFEKPKNAIVVNSSIRTPQDSAQFILRKLEKNFKAS